MSTSTDLPIHEVILKIMYKADREKPVGLSAGDVLWKIDNPEITERYIREVLDWLVRERKVQVYLDKYSLDRYEFLEQKNKYGEEEDQEIVDDKETFYIKPSKKKIKNLRSKILFFIGIIALCSVTYLYSKMDRDYEISTKQMSIDTLEGEQKPLKKLFLSYNEEQTTNKKFEDISYLFSRQNINNKNVQQAIARLYTITDSLQKQQQSRLNKVQKQLDKNINENIQYTNDMLDRIILCNVIFLLIITFTFFKGKI